LPPPRPRFNSPFAEEQDGRQWLNWIRIHSKQRLLLACNVLMTQSAVYLSHYNNLARLSWQDLHLPASTALWDASSSLDWRTLLLHEPETCSVTDTLASLQTVQYFSFDNFQSSVLVTAHTTLQPGTTITAQALTYSISHTASSQLHLHAALLSSVAPLKALMAVAGESWTPAGGRLATHARSAAVELGHMKSTLRSWVDRGFMAADASAPSSRRGSLVRDLPTSDNAVHRAVHHALTIIRLAAQMEEEGRMLPFAGEMPLFAASLVLWAVGYEALRRGVATAQFVPPPTTSNASAESATARHAVVMFLGVVDAGLPARLWSSPTDVNAAFSWRSGVDAIMHWARSKIGGATGLSTTSGGTVGPNVVAAVGSSASAARPRSQSVPTLQSQSPSQTSFPGAPGQAQWGELAAGAVNVLRRVGSRGWAGLWF
jgi:hypothetical protein